jgi:acyl-CoA thioesterase FadM
MTAKLEVRFKKPVQISRPIHVRGEMTRLAGRLIEGRGEIRSVPEGELLAEARGTYIRIPDGQIESYKSVLAWWRVED